MTEPQRPRPDRRADDLARAAELAQSAARKLPGADPRRAKGRPKGTGNKATTLTQMIEAVGPGAMSPLQYLVTVLNDQNKTVAQRLEAARDALPYCHAKASSAYVRGLTSDETAASFGPTLDYPDVNLLERLGLDGGE
jgi:hypothetical protein